MSNWMAITMALGFVLDGVELAALGVVSYLYILNIGRLRDRVEALELRCRVVEEQQ
jgi:hypothetical protein